MKSRQPGELGKASGDRGPSRSKGLEARKASHSRNRKEAIMAAVKCRNDRGTRQAAKRGGSQMVQDVYALVRNLGFIPSMMARP